MRQPTERAKPVHAEISINVAAPARVVFELARDITRWPDLLPHYRKVTVDSRNGERLTASMRAVRPFGKLRTGIPVRWQSEQWSDDADADDLRLRFIHVAGATRGMDVSWHIRPTKTGCRVTIEHDFLRSLPFLGDELFAQVIDRFFVRPIAGRTLATFKSLAES